MILNIPEWVLWIIGLGLGIPLFVVIIFFAYIGWKFCTDFRINF